MAHCLFLHLYRGLDSKPRLWDYEPIGGLFEKKAADELPVHQPISLSAPQSATDKRNLKWTN